MNNCPIIVCDTDLERLSDLVGNLRRSPFRDRSQLECLNQILQTAHIVTLEALPPHVIRMNSKFSVLDLNNSKRTRYELVFPENADITRGKISILAPLGCALLGRTKGQVLEAQVPRGSRRLRIEQVWQDRCNGKSHHSSPLSSDLLQPTKLAA